MVGRIFLKIHGDYTCVHHKDTQQYAPGDPVANLAGAQRGQETDDQHRYCKSDVAFGT